VQIGTPLGGWLGRGAEAPLYSKDKSNGKSGLEQTATAEETA
jgi:hypothetical protein